VNDKVYALPSFLSHPFFVLLLFFSFLLIVFCLFSGRWAIGIVESGAISFDMANLKSDVLFNPLENEGDSANKAPPESPKS